MSERDDALEEAAQAIEHPDFAEFRGVFARTKKGQREYEIRVRAIRETKRSMANYIRSMKSGNGNDIRTALVRVAEAPVAQHDLHMRDAWQMADLGWLDIFATMEVTSNCLPQTCRYRLELTPRGQKVLEEYRAEQEAG